MTVLHFLRRTYLPRQVQPHAPFFSWISSPINSTRCRFFPLITKSSSHRVPARGMATTNPNLPLQQPYPYQKITSPDTIRLMVLQPGPQEEKLRCVFQEHQILNDDVAVEYIKHGGMASDFIAVSYTWYDEATGTEFDFVESEGLSIKITRNLSDLLHRLRDETQSQLFWIDQMCIDQSDEREKEQQIPFMRKIYQQASKVIFWIGEEDDQTSTAFELIEALEVLCNGIDRHNPQFPPMSALSNEDYVTGLGLPSLASGHWKSLLDLLARKVFQRLWIVQEVVLGHEVQVLCGSCTLDFEKLGAASTFLSASNWILFLQSHYAETQKVSEWTQIAVHNHAGRVDFLTALYNRRINLKWKRFENLEHLLLSTRRCETSRDYRQDKLYALHGLMTAHLPDQKLPGILVPNYAKPYTDVFREATQYMLSKGCLDILSGVEDPSLRPADLDLPTWVPNFDIFQSSTILGMPSQVSIQNFAASGTEQPDPSWNDNGKTLYIEACKIDEVSMRSSTLESNEPYHAAYEFLESSAKLVDLFSPYPTGEAIVDVFWRTLIANSGPLTTYPASEDFRRHFMGFCMEAAVSLRLQDALKKLDEAGSLNSGADLATLLTPYFERPEGPTGKFLLHVTITQGILPLWPFAMKKDLRGLYHVFTVGLLGQYPQSYYATTNASAYFTALKHFSFFRRFFVSNAGYFGLIPPSAKAGDGVFILRGGKIPFILRKQEDGLFTIVGECYVHGLMHGEALEKDGFQWERIGIK